MSYDVVVVGCGPSGATSLKHCAKLGLKSIGIEKHKLPRPKPCAGVLYPKVLEDFTIPKEAIVSRLRGVKLVAPSGSWAFIDMKSEGAIVDRGTFDLLLVEEAIRAGAMVLDGASVFKVDLEGDGCGVYVEGLGAIETKFLIAADGVYSRLARGLKVPWRREELALAIQAYVKPKEGMLEEGVFEVNYNPAKVYGGWFWVAHRRKDAIVGVGLALKHTVGLSKLLKELTSFIESKFKHVEVLKREAYMIPIGGPRRMDDLVLGRTLFVGDAGGFVRSDTGEGIYYAMHSGWAAAEAIYECLSGKGGLKELYINKLEEHNLLQLYSSTEIHEVLVDPFKAEAFVERVKHWVN